MNAFAILSRLDNADKHRDLVVLASGLENAWSGVTARGEQMVWRDEQTGMGFRQDGAEVAKFRWDESPPLHESEVKVKVGGIPRMAIRVAGVEGYLALPETLDIIIRNVRDGLAALEPFVRS